MQLGSASFCVPPQGRVNCPLRGGGFKALVEMCRQKKPVSRWWSRALKDLALNLFLKLMERLCKRAADQGSMIFVAKQKDCCIDWD